MRRPLLAALTLGVAASILVTGTVSVLALTRAPELEWRPWSPEAVAKARAEGRPVLVDFTADWCVTCQANKRTSIEISSVRAKLKEINAVALLGDYTREDDAITAELKRFGRAGVPLVLVYPADPKSNPIVLPEVLTPGIVLQALEKAAPESGGEKVGERTGSRPRAAATGVWRFAWSALRICGMDSRI